MQTLREAVPQEAVDYLTLYGRVGGKPNYRPWVKLLDVEVIQKYGGVNDPERPWPGTHRNVNVWWALANGYAVGWNENPSRGWSFPVVRMPICQAAIIPIEQPNHPTQGD